MTTPDKKGDPEFDPYGGNRRWGVSIDILALIKWIKKLFKKEE